MDKFKYFVLVVMISFTAIYSQNKKNEIIHVEWSKNSSLVTSNRHVISSIFVKNQFIDENLLPTYTKEWKISNGYAVDSYKITNIIYEIVSSNSIEKSAITKIPTTLTSKLSVAKARNKSTLILTLLPIVKKGNIIKKISSFEIEYKLKNVLPTSLRLTNRTLTTSVLATGNWYKFAVDTTGVFKIDKRFLSKLGIKTSKINPKNIKIYGNGGQMLPFLNSDFRYDDLEENAIFVSGEDDNVFNDNDFILFYAKGSDAWKVDTIGNDTRHQKNIFSDKAFYFITVDGGQGKRIQDEIPVTGTSNQTITSFNDYTFYEKEEHNIIAIGQQWFGENLSLGDAKTFTIPFNNIDRTEDISVRVRGVVESSTATSIDVSVNGQHLYTINFDGITSILVHAIAQEKIGSLSVNDDNVTVEVTFNNNGNPSSKAFLDYIEVLGKKQLKTSNKQFGFRSFSTATTTGIAEYQIQDATTIWDVTDYINPVKIINQSTTANFEFKATTGTLKEYVSLSESDYYTPEILPVSKVENQNLHALKDIDYVIVTRKYLMNEVERLATFHRERGLTVEVVDLELIYNEFSSGSPDITAIRDFVKHLYDNASSSEKRIKYVCLFGDASYDYKDRIIGNNNIVPAFQSYESFNLATSYVTDDYFGMMDANEGLLYGSDKQDVVTGRIPITKITQASDAIDKIINYNSENSFGDWRNNVTLVADDIDRAGEEILQSSMEDIADEIKVNKQILNVKKIYSDAYVQQISSGGERYPDVKNEISNAIERGTLLLNYFGHGGEDGWAGERILEISQIQDWHNFNTLPLIITITCEFSKFDNPLRLSGGEFMIWNKDGGSISLITTTREIYINTGKVLNERLMKLLLAFNNEDYTIAEALLNVKNQFSTTQRLFIYYLGDPAMKLAVPKADIRLTHMNDVAITASSLDTIKALSHVSFKGIVTNPSGNILTDFNGELSATVFDKEMIKRTLNNDYFGIFMDFDVLESKIFRGRATVENGQFTFDFVAPRDLRIAYGKGKISFYADNDSFDKAGYNFDVTIGGINENAPEDNQGPKIQLFMNDESFIDGGNTNESPILLALLEDENGINTSITAIDHDIVAILDDNTSNPYILNDYYQTELNDYTKGRVTYPFRNLKTGLHTLKLCVWDTYNNQSCATLTFIVVNDSEMVLDNVLNYPNPFVNYTEFWFNHNKPNEPLEVQIQIFTVSGKLVKTINQTVQTVGNLARSVTWDGLDDFGNKIGKGVYVYKLSVKSTLTNLKTEKYEKLVILQ